MSKKLLILENDWMLKKGEHDFVLNFKEKWEGDVIELTSLKSKTVEEIYKAVMECSTIAVQTCFINGSDEQFYDLFHMLAKIESPKDIYIYLMGDDLREHFIKSLDDKKFASIKQHNIWRMATGNKWDEDEHELLDFSENVNRHEEKLRKEAERKQFELEYAQSANQRPTGRRIKIIACTSNGTQFKDLPFGEEVDELDMSETDPNPKRGIWVWGKTEAVKLINDCGMIEYDIVSKLTAEDILEEIGKSTDIKLSKMKPLKVLGLIALIKDREEDAHNIAQFICDELKIERRGNRSRIRELVIKYNNQFKQETI